MVSRLEQGYCDLSKQQEKPLKAASGALSYGQISLKCIKPQDMVFGKSSMTSFVLLIFHKGRIFSLKKNSLVSFSFAA